MITTGKHIAIIGGGPGGLTLARLLQQAGMQIKVFERDENRQVRQQGATLDLHDDSGLKALTRAGLLDQFKKHYRPGADKMRITDAHATVLFDDHAQKSEDHFGSGHFRPEIDRGPLRDILIESLAPDSIQWNSQFTDMTPSGEGWQLRFKNSEPQYADLVIAADGANSKVRPYLSKLKPIYSGITVIEGNIYHAIQNAPELYKLVQNGKVFAFGDGRSIILSAKGEGSLSFYTGTWEEENWGSNCGIDLSDRIQLYNWFKQRFSKWSPLWHELFASNDSYFIPRPMYHYPLDQEWETRANLTMIGDAAHRMPPYAGEGVNMAMLDALELFEALIDPQFHDQQTALQHFEEKMLLRASEITRYTLEQTNSMHSRVALNNMLQMFNNPPQ